MTYRVAVRCINGGWITSVPLLTFAQARDVQSHWRNKSRVAFVVISK